MMFWQHTRCAHLDRQNIDRSSTLA